MVIFVFNELCLNDGFDLVNQRQTYQYSELYYKNCSYSIIYFLMGIESEEI